MKYRLFILLLIFVPFYSVSSQQSEKPKKTAEFYVNSGASFPRKPDVFTEDYNKSYNLGTGFGYELSGNYLMVIELEHDKFNLDHDSFINRFSGLKGGSVVGGDISILNFTFGIKSIFPDYNESFIPYVKANTGFMIFSKSKLSFFVPADTAQGWADTTSTYPSDSSSHIIFQLGAGIDYKLNNSFCIFGEIKYTYAFTRGDRTQYFPLRVGIVYRR